ncbi:MAG TPA: hypothetical protein VGA87_10940 [Pyrinomonadaceae bacterium]|jgi:hypothetical protein
MRFACRTKTEKAWLVAGLSIFVVHRLLDASPPGRYTSDPLSLWLELAMLALSFPSGWLTLFVIHDAKFWCDDCRNLYFLFDWSTLLFAGYIQWFLVLPAFLRSREPTFLDLKRTPEIVSPPSPPAINETASPATPPAATPDAATPHRAFDAAAYAPLLAQFDEAGLTALDKVFQAQSRPSLEASPSHVEAVFPRVS